MFKSSRKLCENARRSLTELTSAETPRDIERETRPCLSDGAATGHVYCHLRLSYGAPTSKQAVKRAVLVNVIILAVLRFISLASRYGRLRMPHCLIWE